MARARRASCSTSPSGRQKRRRMPEGVSSIRTPFPANTMRTALPPRRRLRMAGRPSRSAGLKTQNSSGSTLPCTRGSPRPHVALISTTSGKPDSVSRVNITPLAPSIAVHHALHAGRQRDLRVVEAMVNAVRDGAVVVQRGEHPRERREHAGLAVHVQQGFLLAGEGGFGEVLGGRRGAYRDAAPAIVSGELRVRPRHLAGEIGPEIRRLDPAPDPVFRSRRAHARLRRRGPRAPARCARRADCGRRTRERRTRSWRSRPGPLRRPRPG